eukprot:CAMPEP_0118971002 /NCGR_PEP_ID=MMETSP1173-20130426/7768_1 /TAXON_ID=1034831 /ORGANISM="Rhizochromulina marina cf, Strain CCMP1243" /LENGTH=57 /DNA_ID=CAMNT_0006920427 /DNA_START=103 /DNA_END=276 /DNA_ORIENTATION=+
MAHSSDIRTAMAHPTCMAPPDSRPSVRCLSVPHTEHRAPISTLASRSRFLQLQCPYQ